jgi:hypothetical protein
VDCQMHGEHAAVFALSDNDLFDGKAGLAGFATMREVVVIRSAIARGQQRIEVSIQHLHVMITEQTFGFGAEGLNAATRVDDDQGVRHGYGHRAERMVNEWRTYGGGATFVRFAVSVPAAFGRGARFGTPWLRD